MSLENDYQPTETTSDLSDQIHTWEGALLSEKVEPERQNIESRMVKEIQEYFQTHNFREIAGLEAIQKAMDRENENGTLLVRRESLEAIRHIVENHDDHALAFDAERGGPYPNAAYYRDGRGLKEVFTRGFSQVRTGAITFVLGFQPNKEIQIQPITEKFDYYQPKALEINRMVSGTVHFSDVKFVLVRYARNSFPNNQLTEDEQDRDDDTGLPFVSRLYVFSSESMV